ncbi:hypothetical protein FO519_002615 [Halicephalobus sp. NKZ332]|nr:hypothetical protein FO519_002615 [Halicephalobus sp. NKZ332]
MEGPSTKQTARKSTGKPKIPKNNSNSSIRESSIDSNASCSNDSFFNEVSCERDKSDKMSRELQHLKFHNPGRYNVDLSINRLKRRDEARKKTNTVPQYNTKGQLSYDNEVFERICDCFNKDCPGCFRPCKKCGSRMCGVVCQINRKLIPFKIQEQGAGGQVVKNPQVNKSLMEKLESCFYSGSESETDSD